MEVSLVITVLVLGLNYPGATNVVFAEVPTLHLLALVPMTPGQSSPQPSCNRGEELISAAQLAVERINVRNDVLPGYNLELVPANAETCDQSLVTEAPVNFVRHVTSGDLNIVGVVGLVCSTVTQAISPLAGRPEIDLLQISAGAASPVFHSEEEYPRLYRMIPSSEVYNDAVLALMTTFQWRRISMVRDTILIQHTTTADNFVTKVETRAEFELVFLGDVSFTFATFPVQNLLPKAARIVYASVTASEARELLCESYQKDLHWPEFVWVFHDHSFEDLMDSTDKCSNETMLRALEGVFLLQYRHQPDPNTTLVSGQTYGEYLMELQDHIGTQENQHANALHDSIWAFALALNSSMSESYGPGLDKSNVTALVEPNLKTVRFSGTLGDVTFNEKREVVTEVDIYHVREGRVIHAGHYNPLTDNVTVYLPLEVPSDDFEVIPFTLPVAFSIVTYICTVALLVFTTVVLVLFIYYWNKPSIRAASPYLSLLVFVGCYMLYIGCLLAGAAEISAEHFGSLCLAQMWFCATGVQLIYSALFMRLLRIYRIFFNVFEKPGIFWSDQAMVGMTFIPVSVTVVLLTLWSVLDPIVTGKAPPSLVPTSDPPYYRVDIFCVSDHLFVWLSVILYGVNGCTVVGVAVLATLTRKIHLDCFKDTKQVNAFVVSTTICLCVWLPYTIVLANFLLLAEAAYVFNVIPYFAIPFLCKVFLFVPKIWSARHERQRRRRRSTNYISSTSAKRATISSHDDLSVDFHLRTSTCELLSQ